MGDTVGIVYSSHRLPAGWGRPPPMTEAFATEHESAAAASPQRAHRDDLVRDLPASENKQFYPALDGLRAVAVLMVFWQHYSAGSSFAAAFRWGWTGVDIFFVLSGFLITGILYDTRHAPARFRNFYVRRALRIFPLFYGVLLVALLLAPIFRWVWHPVWALWPLYLGNFGRFLWLKDYLANPMPMDHLVSARLARSDFALLFGHFWSLCIEEQFYLVWPFVVFAVKDRVRLRNLCAASVILCLLGRVICQITLSPAMLNAGFLERFTPLRVDSLLLGGLLALALRGPEAGLVRRLGRLVLPLTLGLFALLQVAALVRTGHALDARLSAGVISTVGYTVIDLLAAGLILNTIELGSVSYRALNNSWLRRLGQISYGFYIFHDMFHPVYLHLAYRLHPRPERLYATVMLIALVATAILSYLSFRFFESPFLRLKRRFSS